MLSSRSSPLIAMRHRAAAAAERFGQVNRNTAANMDHILDRSARVSATRMVLLVVVGTLVGIGCERAPSTGSNPKTPAARAEPNATATTASAPATNVAQVQEPSTATQLASTSQDASVPRGHVAYYFHRTIRCPTCLSIESQSQEAVNSVFAGRVSFRAVNIEEAGNEHFEKDFSLEAQSLVLVEMTTEQVLRWKLLPKTWGLVDEPLEFQKYVVSEVLEFVGG